MKVLICGKGGSGKSTIAVLIANGLANYGNNILLVDADESNLGLHRLMGISNPIALMDNLGGKQGFKEKNASAFPQQASAGIFGERIQINEIPRECIARANGIKLLVIGKIHDFAEGCACMMGVLSKMVLSKLDIGNNDTVIIDTEAGVEHFGRKIDAECDIIFCVVDPSFESFLLANKMLAMAHQAGIEFFFILNKVEENVEDVMMNHLDSEKVVAKIPKSQSVFLESLEGRALKTNLAEIEPVCRLITEFHAE